MKKTIKSIFISCLTLLLSFTCCADLTGSWQGELDDRGIKIPIHIHLKNIEGKQSGLMDSPMQSAFDIKITEVEYDDEKLIFKIAENSSHFEGKVDQKTGYIKGNFIQNGVHPLVFKPIPIQKTSTSSDTNDLFGSWFGKIQIHPNAMAFVVHISEENGELVARADSPDQNVKGMVINVLSLVEGNVTIKMKKEGAEYIGMLSADKQSIAGRFKQSGAVFVLNLVKGKYINENVVRPQNPVAPFDYHAEEVVVENKTAKIFLAGTLLRPKKINEVKATAILITGSGPQDRDEKTYNHKPFLVLADHLVKQGYAVLRMDDRGVGESTGSFKTATSEDFVTDINAAVDFLMHRDDIPKDKVGLIGHSEGGMIAPMLAAQRDDLSFVILLAGPGVPIAQLMAEQNYLIAVSMGADANALKEQMKSDTLVNEALAEIARSGESLDKARYSLKQLLQVHHAMSPEQLEQTIDGFLKQLENPWFKYFISFDPSPYLAQVKVPLLAINGDKDVQVAADSNLSAIESILEKSKHQDFEVKKLSGINHMFQNSETGAVSEYAQITETFAPAALTEVSQWLNNRY